MARIAPSDEIYIKNVGTSATEDDLRELLRQFKPKRIKLQVSTRGGPNQAMAQFESAEVAREVIQHFHNLQWHDNLALRVEFKPPRQDNADMGHGDPYGRPAAPQQPVRSFPPPDHAHSYWSNPKDQGVNPPAMRSGNGYGGSGVWEEGEDVGPAVRARPAAVASFPPPVAPAPSRGRAVDIDPDDFFGGSGAPRVPFYSSEIPQPHSVAPPVHRPVHDLPPAHRPVLNDLPPVHRPVVSDLPPTRNIAPPPHRREEFEYSDGYSAPPMPQQRSRSAAPPPAIERVTGRDKTPPEDMSRNQLLELVHELQREVNYWRTYANTLDAELKSLPGPSGPSAPAAPSFRPVESQAMWRPSASSYGQPGAVEDSRVQFDYGRSDRRPGTDMDRREPNRVGHDDDFNGPNRGAPRGRGSPPHGPVRGSPGRAPARGGYEQPQPGYDYRDEGPDGGRGGGSGRAGGFGAATRGGLGGGRFEDTRGAGGADDYQSNDRGGDRMGPRSREPMRISGGRDDFDRRDRRDGPGDANRGSGCFKCGESGHFSRECPNPGSAGGRGGAGGGGGGNECYNCKQPGHISRDCPEPRKERGSGGGACFNCGGSGHMSRDCTEPRKPRGPGGESRGGSGGYGGGGGSSFRDRDAGRGGSSLAPPRQSKGMVDDAFGEEEGDEAPPAKPTVATESGSALERPAHDEPKAPVISKAVSFEDEAKPIPRPVTEVSSPVKAAPLVEASAAKDEPPPPPPGVIAAVTHSSSETSVPAAPKPRFMLPNLPGKLSKPKPTPAASTDVAPAAAASSATDKKEPSCINCSKPLANVVKTCPDCGAALCTSLSCLDNHAGSEKCTTSHGASAESEWLSPENLRKKEAEKQPDIWRTILDEVQTRRAGQIPHYKPLLVSVVNFKSPDDFWVIESPQLDRELYEANLPKLAIEAPIIAENNRELKAGLLAYSTTTLKPLVKSNTLLVAPGQRGVDSRAVRGDEHEIIFEDFVRCIVLAISYESRVAHVFALDGAFEAEVPIGALRFADDNFHKFAFRAIHCSMADFIAPPPSVRDWPCPEDFGGVVKTGPERRYYGVFGGAKDGKALCQLANAEDFTFIADKLVRNKLAQPAPSSSGDAANISCLDDEYSFYSPYEWLTKNNQFEAKFVTVRNLEDFSLIVEEKMDTKRMLANLSSFYEKITGEPLKSVRPGQLVAVGNGSQWDRAVWRSGVPGTTDCLVELVDAGHFLTNTVNVRIYPLRLQFLVPPAVGIPRCRLVEGLINSIDYLDKTATSALANAIGGRTIKMRVVDKETDKSGSPVLVVDFVESAPIREKLNAALKFPLVTIGGIESYIAIDEIVPAVILEVSLPKQADRNYAEARISPIGVEYTDTLEALEKLDVNVASRRSVPRPCPLQVCLYVTKAEDGGEMFSRVKVLERARDGKVLVEMLDIAEVKEVPVADLIETTKQIANLRRLAIRCRIEFDSRYDDRPSLVEDQTLNFKAGYAHGGWVFTVHRYMSDSGLIPRAEVEGNAGRGVVYQVDSPHSFYMLLTEHEEMLAELEKYPEDEAACFVDGNALVYGELCIAKFEGAWYRAAVRKPGAKPKVLFIDYGNEADIADAEEELRPFHPKFGKWPLQGFLCQLAGISPTPLTPPAESLMHGKDNIWPEEAVEYFKSLIAETPLDFTIVKGGELTSVNLTREEDGLDVGADLIEKNYARRV